MWAVRLEIIVQLWWHHNKFHQVAYDTTTTVTIFSGISVFKEALVMWVEEEYNVKLFFLFVFNSCSEYTMNFIRFPC